jgi:hypothetical protein
MTFPTPSMILYVGSFLPSAETALKKWGMGVIGDWDVGNRSWLSGKETGTVVEKPLQNMREREKRERLRKVRIIWKVNSEESEQDESLQYLLARRIGPGRCCTCGARRLKETRTDDPARTSITMVTFVTSIKANFKLIGFVLRSAIRFGSDRYPALWFSVSAKVHMVHLYSLTVSPIQSKG